MVKSFVAVMRARAALKRRWIAWFYQEMVHMPGHFLGIVPGDKKTIHAMADLLGGAAGGIGDDLGDPMPSLRGKLFGQPG